MSFFSGMNLRMHICYGAFTWLPPTALASQFINKDKFEVWQTLVCNPILSQRERERVWPEMKRRVEMGTSQLGEIMGRKEGVNYHTALIRWHSVAWFSRPPSTTWPSTQRSPQPRLETTPATPPEPPLTSQKIRLPVDTPRYMHPPYVLYPKLLQY